MSRKTVGLTLMAVAGVMVALLSAWIGAGAELAQGPRSVAKEMRLTDADQTQGRQKAHDLYKSDNVPPVQQGLPAQPSVSLAVVNQSGDRCRAVKRDGSYIYTGFGSRFVILDVTNPAQPTEIGSFQGTNDILALDVNSSYAYVADSASGVRVLDVSNPSALTQVSYTTLPFAASRVVRVVGSKLYYGEKNLDFMGYRGVRILDIQDPRILTAVGFIPQQEFEVRDLEWVNDMLYVALWKSGIYGELQVYNSSSPAAEEAISAHVPPGAVTSVDIDGDQAFINVYDFEENVAKMRVLDIASAAEPKELGSYDYQASKLALDNTVYYGDSRVPKPEEMTVINNEAYTIESYFVLAMGATIEKWISRVRVLNVTNPSNIATMGSVEIPTNHAYDIVVNGDYIYVGGGNAGLFTIEITR